MTYLKLDEKLYPAKFSGTLEDGKWGKRESKSVTLEMDYSTAVSLFVDGLAWSIVHEVEQEDGTVDRQAYDNSDYCVAGPITDNRDGTVTAKMGKPTAEELLAIIMGGN